VSPPPPRNGRPKWRAIWPVQSRPIADSGVPNCGEPDCMSMFERNEPKTPGSRADQLHERDAGERLGHLLGERRGIETGDIAPISRNGVITGWFARVVLELRVEHPVVPAQRRVAVDQRDRRRRLLDRLAAAEQDLAHRDRVARVRAGGDRCP
jgi:hypothetical protein